MHERIRDNILAAWGHWVASHPLLTLSACVLLAAGSIVLTITKLEFRADRSQLVDPGREWNRQYTQYKKNFPSYGDVHVVLDGPPGDVAVDELARKIAEELESDRRIASADAGFDVAETSPRLFAFAGREQFDQTLEELVAARRITGAENANAALAVMLTALNEGEGDRSHLDRLDDFLSPYLAAAENRPADFDFLLPNQSKWQPLRSRDGRGRLRFVRVHLAESTAGVNRIGATLDWLRRSVKTHIEHSDRPDTEWGVTGLAAIESDETTEAIHDSTIASLMAIVLITLVMFVAFRGLTVPLLAATALLIGMAWAFGWLIISVGHLQLLSTVFCVILLGLGIDFALLFVSRLELIQDDYQDLPSATARVYRRMGPGMVTGAVTTAAAFAAIAFTDFKGMAEMGVRSERYRCRICQGTRPG